MKNLENTDNAHFSALTTGTSTLDQRNRLSNPNLNNQQNV